jgi:hypothetical protein
MRAHGPEHERERSDPGLRRNQVPRREALATLASTIGNAAFGRLAREGGGLLPGGRVAGAVEAAITARRGRGRPLDAAVRDRMTPRLGDPLADVRVHDDAEAAALARAVSAHAFTTGADVYFDDGQYRPGTGDGDRLLAHELNHVVQQRGAPTSGPLTVTDPAGALEREAEAAAREIAGD